MSGRWDLADWVDQPQEALGINRLHPLARGLTRFLLPSAGVSFEAVNGVMEALTGAVSAVPTPQGLSAGFDDDAKYLVLNDWATDLGAGGCMMIGAIPLIGSVDGTYVMSARQGSGARLYLRRVAGNNWSYGFDGSVSVASGSDSAWAAGVYGLSALQWDATAHEFFFNGTLRNSGSGASITPTTLMLNGLSSNATTASNRELNYTVFAAIWNRRLSAAEHADMWAAPWQVLGPQRIWVPVAAVGGGTDLALADATHGHVADNVVLTTTTTLAIADATHAHTADSLTLSVQSVLAVEDAAHAHAADAITLTVGSHLAVQDALHAHAAGNLALTLDTTIAVAEALHAHAADGVALTMDSTLAVADALHAHAAENVVLEVDGSANLVIADATHAHTADVLALTSAHALIVADATHAHSVDGLVLTAESVLAIQEALHAHAADNVELLAGDALLIADALHAHTSDGVVLTVDAWLVVADALHGHMVDNVVLVDGGTLVVADALHAHAVDHLTLTPVSQVLSVAPIGRVHSLSRRPVSVGRIRPRNLSTRTR